MQMTDVWVNGPFYSIKRLNTENIEYLRIWFLCGMTLKVLFCFSSAEHYFRLSRYHVFSSVRDNNKNCRKIHYFPWQITTNVRYTALVCCLFLFYLIHFFLVMEFDHLFVKYIKFVISLWRSFSTDSKFFPQKVPNAIRSKIGFLLIKVFVKY